MELEESVRDLAQRLTEIIKITETPRGMMAAIELVARYLADLADFDDDPKQQATFNAGILAGLSLSTAHRLGLLEEITKG